MYKINYCPACLSKNIQIEKSKIAKFIACRIFETSIDSDIDSVGIKCNDCEYVGSGERFTNIEENNLYKNYREKDYNDLREFCEPNYLEKISYYESNNFIAERKLRANNLLIKNLNPKLIKTVLDFGGATGEFIPDIFSNADKYVYDISNVELVSGIKKYNNQIKDIDIILCNHVLEHISDLQKIIEKIKKLTTNTCWGYFEVPNNPSPYIGTFHEHINMFNKKSLTKLLTTNNFQIIDTYEYKNLCVLTKFN